MSRQFLGDDRPRQYNLQTNVRCGSPDLPKKPEQITAKSVVSPYFTAKDFSFAYATV